MKPDIILSVLSTLYSMVLRDIIKKAVEDPATEWDNFLIHLLDSLFTYKV